MDTLSIVNDAIIPILEYYDGKEGYNDDYDVDYLCLHDNIADDYHANRIDAYRKYYTLRIDVVQGDTIAYYHITDKPIEDIFADKECKEQFGEVLGYINYNKKPILVSGSGAEAFFKVEGNIAMSPTYRPRVERDIKYSQFLVGDTKGFYIYKGGAGFEFLRTGVIPYWQDREIFLDDIRRARYGNPYTFVPYITSLPQLPSDRLEQYRVVKRKRR